MQPELLCSASDMTAMQMVFARRSARCTPSPTLQCGSCCPCTMCRPPSARDALSTPPFPSRTTSRCVPPLLRSRCRLCLIHVGTQDQTGAAAVGGLVLPTRPTPRTSASSGHGQQGRRVPRAGACFQPLRCAQRYLLLTLPHSLPAARTSQLAPGDGASCTRNLTLALTSEAADAVAAHGQHAAFAMSNFACVMAAWCALRSDSVGMLQLALSVFVQVFAARIPPLPPATLVQRPASTQAKTPADAISFARHIPSSYSHFLHSPAFSAPRQRGCPPAAPWRRTVFPPIQRRRQNFVAHRRCS